MSGLTRRMQILLDDERYRRLEREAAERGSSVASIVREAIDQRLTSDDLARRRAAGDRLLASQIPEGREPDWEDVKNDMHDELYRRWHGDDAE